eukprot:gene25915-11591_t
MRGLIAPVATELGAVAKLTEGRRGPSFNHFKSLSESLQAFSWLFYTGPNCGLAAPSQFVADCWGSAEFYSTKIMMEFKGKEEAQVQWAKTFKELMAVKLGAYVSRHFPQGLKWKAGGVSLQEAIARAASGGPRGPPPPPPPGPPPPVLSVNDLQKQGKSKAASSGGSDMSALMNDLKKGEAITAGLKKVTADMKTKNRTDNTSVVVLEEKKKPPAASAGGPRFPKGEARVELEMERKCKVTHNQLDTCHKTGVMFGDVIASCEVVNCANLQLQCTARVPTLAAAGGDFQLVTAKCSELNVVVTSANMEDEPLELPVPEQFISSFSADGKLVTNTAAYSGA